MRQTTMIGIAMAGLIWSVAGIAQAEDGRSCSDVDGGLEGSELSYNCPPTDGYPGPQCFCEGAHSGPVVCNDDSGDIFCDLRAHTVVYVAQGESTTQIWSPAGFCCSFSYTDVAISLNFNWGHPYDRELYVGNGDGDYPVTSGLVVDFEFETDQNDWFEVLAEPTGPTLVRAYGGDDTLIGGAGVDRFFGGRGQDRLDGKGGRDRLNAGSSDGDEIDLVCGGAGRDEIIQGRGTSNLFSENVGSDEIISAGQGTDYCEGSDRAPGCKNVKYRFEFGAIPVEATECNSDAWW